MLELAPRFEGEILFDSEQVGHGVAGHIVGMNGRVGIGIAPIINHAINVLVFEFAGFFKGEILFHGEAVRRGQALDAFYRHFSTLGV